MSATIDIFSFLFLTHRQNIIERVATNGVLVVCFLFSILACDISTILMMLCLGWPGPSWQPAGDEGNLPGAGERPK